MVMHVWIIRQLVSVQTLAWRRRPIVNMMRIHVGRAIAILPVVVYRARMSVGVATELTCDNQCSNRNQMAGRNNCRVVANSLRKRQ